MHVVNDVFACLHLSAMGVQNSSHIIRHVGKYRFTKSGHEAQ